MSRRLVITLVAGAALSAAGLALAQQTAPPVAGPPEDTVPPPADGDPVAALLDQQPSEGATLVPPPSVAPELTVQENRATSLAEAEAAEEIDPEDLEPPPPPPAPLKRPRFKTAVIRAVDKISAETMTFDVPVGQPVRYKTLVFNVRACESTAPDEDVRDDIAHLEVESQPKAVTGRDPIPARQVFRGWTYASSPSLHPFEHPVYDAWLIACKTSAPTAAGGRR